MTILLVNNYLREPERKLRRCLEVLSALTDERVEVIRFHDIRPGFRPSDDVKAIVLSGSEAYLSRPEDRPFFVGVLELIRNAEVPVLGICFGHQLIGLAFGAEVVSVGRTLKDPKEVVVEEPDDIFASWKRGDKLLVAERHSDEVAQLPEGFVRLAWSDYCAIEAMRHVERPIYGVQFHPERRPAEWPPDKPWDGLRVIRNFLSVAGVAVRPAWDAKGT